MTRLLLGWLGLFSTLLLVGPGLGVAQTRYVPDADSRVWIEGTSTVSDFTCSTQQIEGHARLALDAPLADEAAATGRPTEGASADEASADGASADGAPDAAPPASRDTLQRLERPARSAPARADGAPTVEARVPVRALDCGKRRQNEDLYESMKADRHPTIRYEVIMADIVAAPDSSRDHYVVEAIGDLTIAGETRTVRLTLEGRRLDDGRIQARGSLPMQMTYFDVEPPTAMLGLIRVQDDIVVHFDLTAVPAED